MREHAQTLTGSTAQCLRAESREESSPQENQGAACWKRGEDQLPSFDVLRPPHPAPDSSLLHEAPPNLSPRRRELVTSRGNLFYVSMILPSL